MPIAPRPNSMGLPASSNITSYWSNRRGCDPPSASSALAPANPDTEPDSPVEADSPLVAPRRIQTGQNSVSAVAKNFVPQTGQMPASGCADPSSLPGSSTDPPDSGFTASVFLRQRFTGERSYCCNVGVHVQPMVALFTYQYIPNLFAIVRDFRFFAHGLDLPGFGK